MKEKLYRSRKDKFLGGVCGGLAEYFNTSSTLIRLLWLGLILIDGVGFLLYIIAWIIIPEEPVNINDEYNNTREDGFNKKQISEKHNLIIGFAFVVFGIAFILNNFFPNIISFRSIIGVTFLILGLYLLIRGDDSK